MRTWEDILQGEPQEDWIIRAYTDVAVFAREGIGLDIQPFHEDWLRLALTNPRVSIEAPTGFGKTTMLAIVVPLYLAYFKRDKQALIVSKSLPQAKRILEEFKKTIDDNEMLLDLRPERHEHTWTKQQIVTTTGFRMICRPYSENIKGEHVDYVLCDEAASYKDHEIFFRFVTTRAAAKKGTVCCISTPDNIADLMQVLKTKKDYVCRTYRSISKKGVPLWPNRFSVERLNKLRKEIGEPAFQREYLCNPQAVREGSVFPPNMVHKAFNYGETFSTISLGDGPIFIGADFAISKGSRADFDAYTVIQRVGSKIVLLHGERHKGFPLHAKVRRLGELADRYKEQLIFIVCDPSMIGDAVIEGLRQNGYPTKKASFDAQNRGKMLMSLRKAFETGEMVLPYSPDDMEAQNFVNVLAGELIQIVERRSPATQVLTFVSEGAHDDTVMSLAASSNAISRQKGFFDFGGV